MAAKPVSETCKLRTARSTLKQERRSLLLLQRQARRASSSADASQRRLRESRRCFKVAKERLARHRTKEEATVRAASIASSRKEQLQDAVEQYSFAKKASKAARQKRQAQLRRVQKASLKKDRCEQSVKVQALRARQARILKASERREQRRKAQLEKKQEGEVRALKAAQTKALQNLRKRQSATSSALRQASQGRVKKTKLKQKEALTSYKRWLKSEESRHADQFKRCVGGSLGNDLCILRPKAGKHRCTLVYLHQFNCEGSAYAYYKPHYFYSATKFRCTGLKIVFPNATKIPITAHDGNETYAWYDYKTDYDGVREDKVNMVSLRQTRDRIFEILEREIDLLGGDASKVFIGGASQGCCTALHCAMQFPRVLGGFVGVVGHLLSCSPVPAWKKNMPVILYNGKDDKIMRWPWVRKTFRRFEAAGFTNLKIQCAPGVGHDTGIKEREWLIDFLSKYVAHGS
eukprot:TRINITY_DN33006_c0_g1_i1.p1 TRINITY_DN33006_c0_g1~~TRINITY_DN33006_c0_g1_i1.p1  ORF type:complete len:462 (+),score=71.60 TRINITY_DN33006_c0_g1_i1:50-1435(+)